MSDSKYQISCFHADAKQLNCRILMQNDVNDVCDLIVLATFLSRLLHFGTAAKLWCDNS